MAASGMDAVRPLVGEWTTEMTHPMSPGLVVRGEVAFEWLNGESFLVMRSRTDHDLFPDSVSIIGETDGLQMHYFDDRGVHRVYEMGMTAAGWELSRDAPGFSQRFVGTIEDGGDMIVGLWKLAQDDETFEDDLAIAFRRRR